MTSTDLLPEGAESRPFETTAAISKPNGDSYRYAVCPFCTTEVRVRESSLRSAGKRCDCGAVFKGNVCTLRADAKPKTEHQHPAEFTGVACTVRSCGTDRRPPAPLPWGDREHAEFNRTAVAEGWTFYLSRQQLRAYCPDHDAKPDHRMLPVSGKPTAAAVARG